MNKTSWILFYLLITLSLSACNGDGTPPVATPQTATDTPVPTSQSGTDSPTPNNPTPSTPSLNLLVMATDAVKLEREGWSDYHPTAFGTVLNRGDQIWPVEGAEVVVLCDSLELWHVPAGVPSGLTNGCPEPEEPILTPNGSLIQPTRNAIDPFIPYIISPRMTGLLTKQPTLRWNEVIGASSYTVGIQGLDWKAEGVIGTELVYPGSPPLEAEKSYLLTITADNGRSSTEEEPTRLGFVLLPDSAAQEVRSHTAKLEAHTLPNEANSLALAHLYASEGLLADAIEILEPLATNGSQTAATYRLLADLYQQIGLPLLAEPHYTQALTLTSNDIEAQAAAQTGLGQVYASLNNKAEATRWLQQARDGYQSLGDMQRVEEVEKLLVELE